MKLTEEQQRKFLLNINAMWKHKLCNICGTHDWTLTDIIFELREFNNGDHVIGEGKVFPVVPITCKKCGNTHFINPYIFGVIPPPTIEGENK
jgi:RNase P subunit RPR2